MSNPTEFLPQVFPSVAAAILSAVVVVVAAAAAWWPAPLGGQHQRIRTGRLCPAEGQWNPPVSGHPVTSCSTERLMMQDPADETLRSLRGSLVRVERQLQEHERWQRWRRLLRPILARLRAAATLGEHLPAPGGQLDGFVHAWESNQLLREAEATVATVMPVVAPVARRATAPDAPVVLEDLQLVPLLSSTTWPFCGTRHSTLDVEVSIMTHQLVMQFHDVLFQPYCSGALEYDSNFYFDPSRLCSLLPDDWALHTGDSRPQEADAGNLPPHVAGAVDHRVGRLLLNIASRPTASDRDSLGVP